MLIDARLQPCAIRSRKARALLAFLASKRDVPVPRDLLADLLWGDRDEVQARASLRQCLHQLRGAAASMPPLLEVQDGHVLLNGDALAPEPDVECWPIDAGIEWLVTQLTRGGGVLFSDLNDVSDMFEDWLRAERMRRRSDFVHTAVRVGEAGMQAGLLPAVQQLIALLETIEPLNECVARLGLLADAADGDRAALETRYRRLRQRLGAELQVEPAPETQVLHDALSARSADGPAHGLPERAAVSPRPASPPTPAGVPPAVPSPAWRRSAQASLVLGLMVAIGLVARSRQRPGRQPQA